MSKQETEKIVTYAGKFKLEDQEYKRKVDAFNALEDCLYLMKKKMKGNDIPIEVRKNMEYACDDTTKCISKNKTASAYEIVAKKGYLEFITKLAFSN